MEIGLYGTYGLGGLFGWDVLGSGWSGLEAWVWESGITSLANNTFE